MENQNNNNKNNQEMEKDVLMDVEQSANSTLTNAEGRNALRFFHRDRVNSAPSNNCRQTPIERLGSKIGELLEYIKDRNNVHGEIKKLARSIDTAYHLALKDLTAAPKMGPSKIVKTTQTSPGTTVQSSVSSTPNPVLQKPNPKKRLLSASSPESI